MRTRGFTLIELLMSVALLTMLATAAVSWAVSQRRSGVQIERRYERLQQVLACRQAIREDLVLALTSTNPLRPDNAGKLVIATLRHGPEEVPGRREVTWAFDGEHQALVRISHDESGEQRRVALVGVASARFVQEEERGLVLEMRPLVGEVVSLVLRSGP